MDPKTQMEIEWQCIKLCYAFSHCIDNRKYQQLVELFTEDGEFNRVGQVLSGRKTILDALQQRSTDIRTRHVCTNFHFLEVGEEMAKAHIYNVTYVGKGDPEGEPVHYGMSHGGAFLEFQDTYRKTGEGWKIAERLAATMITPEEMPHH